MLDLLIRNGMVYDGSGAEPVRADVAVSGGKIEAVGNLAASQARETIDASGRAVSPGFLDMHSHSDFTLMANAKAESKIRQGVTTEIVGNCGSSPAPLDPATEHLFKAYRSGAAGMDWQWRRLGEYLERLEKNTISVNVAQLHGHGTTRIAAMGFANRPPTAEEMAHMKRLVAEGMDDGAIGFSTGLIYTPGTYSKTEELIELAQVAAAAERIYASHIRGESATLIDAVAEAIRIGREAGIPVQISHHKAVGPRHWGKVHQTLRMVEEARAEGIDVTCDQYPYTASSTTLMATLPTWTLEGGVPEMVKRLRDRETRARIRRQMLGEEPADGLMREYEPDKVFVARCVGEPGLEGKHLAQIAQEQGYAESVDCLLDMLERNQGAIAGIFHGISEEDVHTVMRHPSVMIGSDGSALAPYGPLGQGKPHPRSYGTFPRVLGRYVRELGVISLQDAVRKMTSAIADKLKLRDRGWLKPGYAADIVVFDPATVADRATYEEPAQYPVGIDHVIVNGVVTIRHGEHAGATAGRVLRGGRS